MRFISYRDSLLPMLGLFTSMGTLLCCALPALLVTLGMGAAMAGLVTTLPFLVTISDHKEWVFGVAGVLIILSATLQWIRRNAPCPADPNAAKACMRLRCLSLYITAGAGIIYTIGVFFAFIAPRVFY